MRLSIGIAPKSTQNTNSWKSSGFEGLGGAPGVRDGVTWSGCGGDQTSPCKRRARSSADTSRTSPRALTSAAGISYQ